MRVGGAHAPLRSAGCTCGPPPPAQRACERSSDWRRVPECLTREFILGYFDGDGFVTSHRLPSGLYPYLGIVSGSRDFLEAVARAVEQGCGVAIGGPWRKGTSNCYVIRAAGRRARVIDEWLHQDGMGLARKRIAALGRAPT